MEKVLISFFILFNIISSANDGAMYSTGGTIRFMGKEHPSVRMNEETVFITIKDKESFSVKVLFTFENFGKAAKVLMGFPEISSLDVKNKSSFQNFKSFVNNSPITVKRKIINNGEGGIKAVWIKEVSFKEKEILEVEVQYDVPFSGGLFESGAFYNTAFYIFTGGNWKDKVKSSKVILTYPSEFKNDLKEIAFYSADTKDLLEDAGPVQENLNTVKRTFVINDWQAEGYIQIGFEFPEFNMNLSKDPDIDNTGEKDLAEDNENKDYVEYDNNEYQKSSTTFNYVDEMPQFPGGIDSLLNFILTNIKINSDANGKVFTSFLVDKYGNIKNVQVIKVYDGLSDEYRNEAIRIISSMPKWKPGKFKGKPVDTQVSIPVEFRKK